MVKEETFVPRGRGRGGSGEFILYRVIMRGERWREEGREERRKGGEKEEGGEEGEREKEGGGERRRREKV